MKGQTYVILTFVFVILIAVFAIINVESVEVNYFFWKKESPLILLILFSALMGGLVTMIAGSFKYFNLKRENKRLFKENENLKGQLTEGEQDDSLVDPTQEAYIDGDNLDEEQK